MGDELGPRSSSTRAPRSPTRSARAASSWSRSARSRATRADARPSATGAVALLARAIQRVEARRPAQRARPQRGSPSRSCAGAGGGSARPGAGPVVRSEFARQPLQATAAAATVARKSPNLRPNPPSPRPRHVRRRDVEQPEQHRAAARGPGGQEQELATYVLREIAWQCRDQPIAATAHRNSRMSMNPERLPRVRARSRRSRRLPRPRRTTAGTSRSAGRRRRQPRSSPAPSLELSMGRDPAPPRPEAGHMMEGAAPSVRERARARRHVDGVLTQHLERHDLEGCRGGEHHEARQRRPRAPASSSPRSRTSDRRPSPGNVAGQRRREIVADPAGAEELAVTTAQIVAPRVVGPGAQQPSR